MGGMASGEIASSRTVAAILANYVASASSGDSVSSRLLQAINAANLDVWQLSQTPEHKGMGTTAVAAALDGNKLIIGNVGDSRAYHCARGHCVQVTVDHSYINELIRTGAVSLEDARTLDLRGTESIISRAIGADAKVEPDFFAVDLEPGSVILLASDGLHRYVTPEEIVAILSASSLETACGNFIEVAKQRGGKDNITCLILFAPPTE
jgi:protein phosphatase